MLISWGKTSSSFSWTKQFLLAWIFLVLLPYHSTKCQLSLSKDLEEWKTSCLLPSAVRPHEYNLRLEPRIEKSDFLGEATVFFTTTSPRKSVILHSRYLNITKVSLYSTGPAHLIQFDPYLRSVRQQVDVSEWFLYEEHEFLVVKLKEDLEPELEYVLDIHYRGSFLNGKLNGFYTSAYKYLGDKKVIATTQFEPNDARMAFPCFDEPDMKAIFDIEIIKPSQNATIVSNMPVLKEVYDDNRGKYLVQFECTPIMSTYTLCWIISDFQVVEEFKTSSGVLVRGLARRGHEGFLGYATDITKKSLEYYENYLGVPYSLSKLELIGIPDFGAGAMENWGMVTYRDTNIIINDQSSGYMDYYSVTNVVCHEVAHMWFGNLVTMKWWDDLWLNEGFATFFSMKCTRAVQPQFNVDELIYIKIKLSGFDADSVINIHPVVNSLTKNNQLSGTFDEITYRKGHSLLQMVEDTMGCEAFQQGLNLYLNRFALGNTETPDLSEALDEVSELDISCLIEDWTRQPGHPVVTVEKQDNLLYLTQFRFVAKDKQNNKNAFSYRWDIPIKFRTADDPNKVQFIYFSKQNKRAVIELKSSSSWFKLNTGHIGFYKVNYPEDIWKDFEQSLMNFDPVVSDWSDRANLLYDACNLANAGHIKYSTILGLFSYLSKGKETHYAPWQVASKCLNDIKGKLSSRGNTSALFTEHVRNLISPLLPQTLALINKEKSSPYDFDLQNEVIFSLACSFKHPEALNKARYLFELWLKNCSALNLDIKAAAFKHGVSGKDEESRWERLWSLYQNLDDPYELRDLRIGLTSINNTALQKKLAKLSRDENFMRVQDYYSILSTMAKKSKTMGIVWDLFTSDFSHLQETFSAGRISSLFQTVASNFETQEELEEMKEFVKKHPSVVPHKNDLNRVEEIISSNLKWSKSNDKDIYNWLTFIAEQPATD